MGQIIDVIVKRDGQVRAAVIDFGGFLGVGSRKIAVDWSALSFPAQQRDRSRRSEPHPRSSQVGPRISTRRTTRRPRRGGTRSAQAGSFNEVGKLYAGEVTLSAARPLRDYGRRGRPAADGDEAHADEGPDQDSGQNSQPAAGGHLPAPSPSSLRGLDWFVFFLADAQMGFGPLVAVYLTTQKWTQGDIGLVLTAGGLVALAGQMPGAPWWTPPAPSGAGCIQRCGDRCKCAHDRRMADLCRGAGGQALALSGKLHPRTGDRGTQPWTGRSRCHGREARPQCPLRFHWSRPRRGRDGHGRLLDFKPGRLFRHRRALCADAGFTLADRRGASRSGASAWRQGRCASGRPDGDASNAHAQSPAR